MAKVASIVGNNTHEAKLAYESLSAYELKMRDKERAVERRKVKRAAKARAKEYGSVWA